MRKENLNSGFRVGNGKEMGDEDDGLGGLKRVKGG